MLDIHKLKNVIQTAGLTRKQQVLLCLALSADQPKGASTIRDIALNAGVRRAKNWNTSSVLASLGPAVARTRDGWELTDVGKKQVAQLLGGSSTAVASAITLLKTATTKLKSTDVRRFVEEAIACAEACFYRAAVVLSWVGAVAVLYDVVVASHLGKL